MIQAGLSQTRFRHAGMIQGDLIQTQLRHDSGRVIQTGMYDSDLRAQFKQAGMAQA